MEDNVADALKMAGSVLLFVLGLSIAILALSQARESLDIILSYSDRESLTIENDERYYYLASENDTNRYVEKKQLFQLYIVHIKKITKLFLNFQIVIIYINKM